MDTVTCRNPDCVNADRPVPMLLSWVDIEGATRSVDAVMCGACGEQISDVVAGEGELAASWT